MPDPTQTPTRPLWRDAAAIALLFTATLKIMANATISPALPGLEASFADVPGAAYLVRFLVSAPSLTVVLVAPFAGLFADRFGKGRLMVAGVVLFVLSGSAGAYLTDLHALIASRLLLGVAVAMTMTAQVALVGDLFGGARRSVFLGWQTVAINFSGFGFIALSGVLADQSARLPFLVYALPVLLLPLLTGFCRTQPDQDKMEAQTASMADAVPPGASAWWPAALGTGALMFVSVLLFFQMPSQLPFFLAGHGFERASATAHGLGVLMISGGVTALMFNHLKTRLGLAATLSIGFSAMGAGFAGLTLGADWAHVLTGAGLIGAGYALVQPACLFLALEIAPDDKRGRVSGIVTTALFAGQVVSPLVLTYPIAEAGFEAVFLSTAIAFWGLAASGLVFGVMRRGRAGQAIRSSNV